MVSPQLLVMATFKESITRAAHLDVFANSSRFGAAAGDLKIDGANVVGVIGDIVRVPTLGERRDFDLLRCDVLVLDPSVTLTVDSVFEFGGSNEWRIDRDGQGVVDDGLEGRACYVQRRVPVKTHSPDHYDE